MSDVLVSRRTLLSCGAGALTAAACLPAHAAAAHWLPYDPAQTRVLMPRSSGSLARAATDFMPAPEVQQALSGYKRIGPARAAPATSSPSDRADVPITVGRKPPTAYALTAERSGVPAWLLFGVALQESQLAFGREVVPYPWTLCVRGRGERYASYEQTLAALRRHVRAGISNVDCGAMQVNWGWHRDKLRTHELALDPYPNLAVGASILRGHFDATGSWSSAAGRYHTGSVDTSERRERAARYASAVFTRLQRLGADTRFASREARHA